MEFTKFNKKKMKLFNEVTAGNQPSDELSRILTSTLEKALKEAENLFGPCDPTWTILGWELTADGPRIWYPKKESKQIIIRLNTKVANNYDLAIYQLCHEAVHCLSPTDIKSVNVLEEGLATYFSNHYLKEQNMAPIAAGVQKYEDALSLTEQLLDLDKFFS